MLSFVVFFVMLLLVFGIVFSVLLLLSSFSSSSSFLFSIWLPHLLILCHLHLDEVLFRKVSSVSVVVVDDVEIGFGVVVGIISGNLRVSVSDGLLDVVSTDVVLPDFSLQLSILLCD